MTEQQKPQVQALPRFDKPRPRWPRIVLAVLAGVVVIGLAACWMVPMSRGGAPGLATVQVTSAAPAEGVQVAIVPAQGGETLQGQTPWQVALAPGDYRYVAAAPGYRSTNGSISVPPGTPTVAVEIPALEPAAGKILVRSNAPVDVYVDGVRQAAPAGPDPAVWAAYGSFAEGPHVVSATAALGSQSRTIEVSSRRESKVEFLWGSRLQVVVEPADIPSVTIRVDDRPYTGPVDYDAGRLSSRPFVEVVVAAPGYETWADSVFLRPGAVTVVTATLTVPVTGTATLTVPVTGTAGSEEQEVLAAYWKFWQVWNEAGATFDSSRLAEIMTGDFLVNEQEGFDGSKAMGTMASWSIIPSPHTPTVANFTGETADVQVICDITQTITLKDGTIHTQVDHLEGAFTMQRGEDNAWRVASWEGSWQVRVEPTPVASGGGGGGTAPPDRAKIITILLANVNCLRAEAGLPPVKYDWEMAAAVQPIADAATAYAKDRMMWSLPDNQAEIEAAVRPYGGVFLAEYGIALSWVPGNAREGTFASDWENYDGDPYPMCAAGWEREVASIWLRPSMTRVAIVLGPANWFGAFYMTVLIAVGR